MTSDSTTFLKVYMELGSYFLFEQIKDIIIVAHLTDSTSGPSGCPRNRETHTSKFQVTVTVTVTRRCHRDGHGHG